MVTDDCPSCGEPVAGAVATEPGIEEIVPCGCRAVFDGGSVHGEDDERGARSVDGTEHSDTVEHVSIIEYNEKAADFDKQPGERVILNGCRRKASVHDDERGCFERIGEAVAIIELHQPIPESEVTDWCNSPAGKLALAHWFDHVDPDEVVMT